MLIKPLTTIVRLNFEILRTISYIQLLSNPTGIRSKPSIGNSTFNNGINSAILRYNGAPVSDPKSIQLLSVAPLVESNLRVCLLQVLLLFAILTDFQIKGFCQYASSTSHASNLTNYFLVLLVRDLLAWWT